MSNYATTAAAVANFFIDHTACYVDNLKLQKLVYISFGWYSANFDDLLFPDRIEAWKHGPVIPSLYHQFKVKGSARIIDPAVIAKDNEDEDEIKLETPRLDSNKDKDTLELLDSVYSIYNQATGWGLRKVTHKEGTPWSQIYYDPYTDEKIPSEIIREYYRKLKRTLEKINHNLSKLIMSKQPSNVLPEQELQEYPSDENKQQHEQQKEILGILGKLNGVEALIKKFDADYKEFNKAKIKWWHWVIGLVIPLCVSIVLVVVCGPIGSYYITTEYGIGKTATRNERQLKKDEDKLKKDEKMISNLKQELQQKEIWIEENHKYVLQHQK